MRVRETGAGVLAAALCALMCASAAAEPGSGPRETVDQTFTTTQPGASTGVGYDGRYHAAGDEQGEPPYMRRMVFYPPEGMRYDTSVPERCTANDFELSMNGPAACPEGSRLGGGETWGILQAPVAHSVVIDRYTHTIDIMNNTNEQIVLIKAEGYAVVRGKFQPDGSIEFNNPTCFPQPPSGCVDEHVIQLGTSSLIPAYTNDAGAYATTPPTCPASGHWTTRIAFWWSDGSFDDVATTQPCSSQ
jgi:hypothetical protein